MVNKKEFEGYICEITNKPIRKMKSGQAAEAKGSDQVR